MSESIEKKLEKLEFQIRLIGDAIDYRKHPITHLVIEMNWSDADLEKANDIFEKYDKMLDAGVSINWTEFEMEIKETFAISYQRVKSIILAFYRNQQWTRICRGFAREHKVMEFDEINTRISLLDIKSTDVRKGKPLI